MNYAGTCIGFFLDKWKFTHVGDDPMERAFCIAKTVLTRRELAEVPCCERYHVIE